LELATNAVFVNGQAAYRKGEYFRQQLAATNASAPQWLPVSISATNETTATGHLFVPQTPEQFTYDLDGNLLTDGRWNYTWDAENRLTAMAPNTSTGSQISLKFEYDWKGRRVRKQVWGNANWSGSPTNDIKFAYDGWNLIAILSTNSQLLTSFVWGLDLSGSQQGAGGIGGLLMMHTAAGSNYFTAFNGNGDVAALINSFDGSISARYEYGVFGEALRATGPVAKTNPFRFSTKYQDDESDIVLYPARPWHEGRFLSRDPIEEEGGINLYAFVNNNPANATDPLGLIIVGFYGADTSYSSPNIGNVWLEQLSGIMEEYETVLRPLLSQRTLALYHSRAVGQAFTELLLHLDKNRDGYYDPPCDPEETIKIFGWSWGGASAVELANRIKNSGRFKEKNIGLVAVIDPVTFFRPHTHTVPDNVYRFWNRYQRHGANVMPLGLPNHGHALKIADPSKTIADQIQLDPNGQVVGLDHITIIQWVADEFLGQFFQ